MSNPIPLKVIQLTAFSSVATTIQQPETRFFLADGNMSYKCGKCDCVLAENIHLGMLSGMILRCNNCGSYNEMPAEKLVKRILTKYKKKKN